MALDLKKGVGKEIEGYESGSDDEKGADSGVEDSMRSASQRSWTEARNTRNSTSSVTLPGKDWAFLSFGSVY